MPWEPVDINAHYYWNEVGTSRAIGESCQYLSADRGKYYREYIQNMMKNEPGRKFCAYNAGQRPEAADVLLKETFRKYVARDTYDLIILAICHDSGYLEMFGSLPWNYDLKPQIVLLTSKKTHHVYMQTPFSIRQWNNIFRNVELNKRNRDLKQFQLLKDAKQEREAMEEIHRAQTNAGRPSWKETFGEGKLLKDIVIDRQAVIDRHTELTKKHENYRMAYGSEGRTCGVSIRTMIMIGQKFGSITKPSTSLNTIKELVEDRLGIPARYQRLIWWGRDVTDSKEHLGRLWNHDWQEILLLPKTAD